MSRVLRVLLLLCCWVTGAALADTCTWTATGQYGGTVVQGTYLNFADIYFQILAANGNAPGTYTVSSSSGDVLNGAITWSSNGGGGSYVTGWSSSSCVGYDYNEMAQYWGFGLTGVALFFFVGWGARAVVDSIKG